MTSNGILRKVSDTQLFIELSADWNKLNVKGVKQLRPTISNHKAEILLMLQKNYRRN